MAGLTPSLQQKITANPDANQNVIVRVTGDLDARQKDLQVNGFQIRRKLSLIGGFAATASGANILRLSNFPWVISIEEDQQVHTTT